MNGTLYFYTQLDVKELEAVLVSQSEWLEAFLHELYDSLESEELLRQMDDYSEELALIEAHPVHEELRFEDLTTKLEGEEGEETPDSKQRDQRLELLFKKCRSCLVFQNLPDFHLNPLQVSVVKNYLKALPEVLVDGFLDETVSDGGEFLSRLNQTFKEALVAINQEIQTSKTKIVVDDNPLEMRIRKILFLMRELNEEAKQKLTESLVEKSPKLEKLLNELIKGTTDSRLLFQKSGLHPKDFSDGIERIYLLCHH